MPQTVAAAVAAVAGGLGVSTAVASALVQLGAGFLLSAVSNALFRPSLSLGAGRDLEIELAKPQSLPSKRFAYGSGQFVTGSPAPAWVTLNGNLYCCHILNSRASQGIAQLSFDRRYMDPTGDILDFTGDGADVDHPQLGGYVRCWLGLGDQTGPPDAIMTEIGDATSTDEGKFWPTDRWTGSTVLWGVYRKGAAESMRERWPSAPPEVGAIGNWSYVWDPRDVSQDADDPSTWTVSNNAWLCILDVLRFNPLSRWSLAQINIDSFKDAADDADATRTRLDASTEPRWRIGGTALFKGAVLLDVIKPMVDATGGDILIDGTGLTAIPAKAQTPVMTVTDWIGGTALEFRARQKARDLPKAVQATWPQPEAKYESQTMQPVVVPGQTWNGGDDRLDSLELNFVPFAGQVQHLQQIRARKLALGRTLSLTVGPEVFAEGAQAGDWLTINFGTDYATRNGTYQIEAMESSEWMQSEDMVSFVQRIELRETGASVYAWDAATDELPVYAPASVPEYDITLDAPESVTLYNDGEAGVPIIFVEIYAETSILNTPGLTFRIEERIGEADFEFSGRTTANYYQFGGESPPPPKARAIFRIRDVLPETEYDIRVRAESTTGLASEWIEESITTPAFAVIINGGDY